MEPVVQIDGAEVPNEHFFGRVSFCGFKGRYAVKVAAFRELGPHVLRNGAIDRRINNPHRSQRDQLRET